MAGGGTKRSRDTELSWDDFEESTTKRQRHLGPSPSQMLQEAPPAYHQRPGTVDRLTDQNYIAWLKSIDFRPPNGMQAWMQGNGSVTEYTLFTRDNGERCFIQMMRDHVFIWAYRSQVVELEFLGVGVHTERQKRLPKYAVVLGHVYIRQPYADGQPERVLRTNYSVVMDVTKPTKSLWMIYNYGYGESFAENLEFFKGNAPFDMARIADSLEDFVEDESIGEGLSRCPPYLDGSRVIEIVQASANFVVPIFTTPNLDSLLKAIEDGWGTMSF
ncbi:Uu.00g061710.m01.CDS01 [Anthostomella pinea]|uniref:Uu.00g061710.m01.CDS01 n=1 Tax=Anthostomella pinea TaxID=933095 RepID=A0AAI8VSG3_9PEZI|nr:Uu.00g061710.m01.CDS01 [Anthostomella pinea]